MDKYQQKYRIASARAPWWNYGWGAAYFVTICTKNRLPFFGNIEQGVMQLSHCGVLANVFWHEIPQHQPIVTLDAFVVMPNHIHGIVIINDDTDIPDSDIDIVEARHALPLPNPEPTESSKRFRNPGKNTLSSIIGGYKSAVTKHANRLRLDNGWQSRFHDHIIRKEEEYQRIKNYIENNPLNWTTDKFHSKD